VADADALNLALAALAEGDTELAAEAAAELDDPVARDIVEWTRLRRGGAAFDDYVAFLDRNPDWPGLPYLRAQGEPSLPRGGDADRVIAYFGGQAPRTGMGALALANAYNPRETQAARDVVTAAWTGLTMSGDAAASLRSGYQSLLNEGDLHIQRLDHLLWEGAEDRARAMFPLVPDRYHPLAEARLGLRNRVPGVDALIEAVPDSLADDPGLAFERFIWRIRSGFWDTAGELLAERSTSAEALGRPAAWADRRADLARDVMREGEFQTCYDYAANHFLIATATTATSPNWNGSPGTAPSASDRFETALDHFIAFRDTVFSPISMGRAGYWLGRTHEAWAMRRTRRRPTRWARYQSSFYGQLAQERGGLPVDPTFLAEEDLRQLARRQVHHLLRLPRRTSSIRSGRARPLRAVPHPPDRKPVAGRGRHARRLRAGTGDAHVALRIAKRAAQNGHEIMRAYYPVTDLAEGDWPIDPALALSIARRESEFDPGVISHAGAMGLMQVMPGTGRDTAAELEIEYEQDRVLGDPDYNALLATSYIAGLNERFDGNVVLVSAGYNAGPRRASDWIERFGDPRQRGCRRHHLLDRGDPLHRDAQLHHAGDRKSRDLRGAADRGTCPEIGLSERLLR
jgi:soluble lytic murein transglycosylase